MIKRGEEVLAEVKSTWCCLDAVSRKPARLAREIAQRFWPTEYCSAVRLRQNQGVADPKIRIGIGGWTYEPWRGTFYPDGLPQKRELEYAARSFGAIEINGTFYGRQSPKSWEKLGKGRARTASSSASRDRAMSSRGRSWPTPVKVLAIFWHRA